MSMHSKSANLFEQAQKYLVGGVNSPVRSFKSVGGTPLFIKKGQGPYLLDVDGNKYIDFVNCWGALILGHRHPAVISAIKKALKLGTSFGAPTKLEAELAQLIQQAYPSMELIRLVNSGTEAVMAAIRLARGYTGREKIVKFAGCYHGFSDPESTVVLAYNDIAAVEKIFQTEGEQIAAIIIEPVAANMGVVLPQKNFLQKLRQLTEAYKSLLIFDEVVTGFRVGQGGAQEFFGIKPDLTCLGKIIGGGLPVGAFGGKKEIMSKVAPLGPVYQAGTFSGNPLTTAAGIATLKILKNKKVYSQLAEKTKILTTAIKNIAQKYKISLQLNSVASMFTIFFTDTPVFDYDSAKNSDTKRYAKFFHQLLRNGVYFPPSPFETCFLSTTMGEKEIDITLEAVEKTLRKL